MSECLMIYWGVLMMGDQCMERSLMSSISFFSLSGTKAIPPFQSLSLLRILSFSFPAMLASSNISRRGASMISSILPFSSEWSRQASSFLRARGAGGSAIVEMGVEISLLEQKRSLMIPKRQMMPRKMSILLILLVRASLSGIVIYLLGLVASMDCLSWSFYSLRMLHSSCSFLFISSNSLTRSFFLSLEICAEILFLCFLVSSSSSSSAIATALVQVFLTRVVFFLFLARFLLSRLFCFNIFLRRRSRSTPLKARFTSTKRRIS